MPITPPPLVIVKPSHQDAYWPQSQTDVRTDCCCSVLLLYAVLGCAVAGSKGKKTEEVIDLLDEEEDAVDSDSQQMRSSPQPASAPRVIQLLTSCLHILTDTQFYCCVDHLART